MQEEITQGVVSLSVETGKMTADLLQKAVKKVLEEMQKKPSQRTLHQGKQTLHQLKQHGASLTNIEITEQNIKAFSVVAKKYMEHFKQPEQFINLNGQIVALPVEPENPLRTAEMTLEDDYGMIDGIINNGRRGEELEKAQDEARRTTPEKKPSIRERLEDAKRECGERKPPDKAHQKKPPEHDL